MSDIIQKIKDCVSNYLTPPDIKALDERYPAIEQATLFEKIIPADWDEFQKEAHRLHKKYNFSLMAGGLVGLMTVIAGVVLYKEFDHEIAKNTAFYTGCAIAVLGLLHGGRCKKLMKKAHYYAAGSHYHLEGVLESQGKKEKTDLEEKVSEGTTNKTKPN